MCASIRASLLVIDRSDGQIAFEFFEGLLDLGELDVVLPQLGRRCSGEIRAEQVASFSTPNRSEFVSVQRKCEALGGDGLVFRWQMQVDKRIGPSRLFLGRPEFD